MDNGWEASADAWIRDQGERGDFSREYVLDPIVLPRSLALHPKRVLDVGCGEGRFCRVLKRHGIDVTGIDPTVRLLDTALARDPEGDYVQGRAEHLPFAAHQFDLVISYLTLIDITDPRLAIDEMVRVLAPGGALLIANLNPLVTSGGWIKDDRGERAHFGIDNYMTERPIWIEYRGIRVVNHHRPASTYMKALIGAGLRLTYFEEPLPQSSPDLDKEASFVRVPWLVVMEWIKA